MPWKFIALYCAVLKFDECIGVVDDCSDFRAEQAPILKPAGGGQNRPGIFGDIRLVGRPLRQKP